MLKKSFSGILVASLFSLCVIPSTTIHAVEAQSKMNILKKKYTHSEKYYDTTSEWKRGLQTMKPLSKKTTRTTTKSSTTMNSLNTMTESFTSSVTYANALRKNEVHYYRILTSVEGTINLSVSAQTTTPDVFITNLQGTFTYRNGSKLPAGEHVVVVQQGMGAYNVRLSGLTFSQQPEATLPELNLTQPTTTETRLSNYDQGYTFKGSTDAHTLLFGVDGSNSFQPLPSTFEHSITFNWESPVYNNYAFRAENNVGNSIYRVYQIIHPSIYSVDGATRYETAVRVSQMLNQSTAKSVIITRGDSNVDAVSSAVLSKLDTAPILLTPPTNQTLRTETLDEIKRLRPETAYIIGDTTNVSAGIEQQLKSMNITVNRLQGANRQDTSANIADYFTQQMNAINTKPDTAFVVNGNILPDATSALGAAIDKGYPVLYTTYDTVPLSVENFIKKYPQYKKFIILGDTGVVSDSISQKLLSYSTSNIVERVAGADRYATSVAIAKKFYPDLKTFAIANGQSVTGTQYELYPDAVISAPLVAKHHGTVLLSTPSQLQPTVKAYLDARYAQGLKIDQIFAIAGSDVLGENQMFALYKYLD